MVYDPNNKPVNPYAGLYENFIEQTRDHVLTVTVDDGLNRRLRVGAPDTGIWSWNIITWPGYLATFGDIADGFMFSRIEDMIDFFDRRGHRNYFSDGSPSIDFRYWAEKLSGGRTHDVREYSSEVFIQRVAESLEEHAELGAAGQEERREEILAEARRNADSEHEAREYLSGNQDLFGQDAYWDWALIDYNIHFIFACYAIDLSVKLWRKYEASVEARAHRRCRDKYILVDGGLVQNNPALPVFDLDVLDSDFPNHESASEALNLYERISEHPQARLDLTTALSDAADFVRAHGYAEDIETIESCEAKRLVEQAESKVA